MSAPQSDDSALVRQIRDTHTPGRSDSHSVDVNEILQVIEEIFHRTPRGHAGGLLVFASPILFILC